MTSEEPTSEGPRHTAFNSKYLHGLSPTDADIAQLKKDYGQMSSVEIASALADARARWDETTRAIAIPSLDRESGNMREAYRIDWLKLEISLLQSERDVRNSLAIGNAGAEDESNKGNVPGTAEMSGPDCQRGDEQDQSPEREGECGKRKKLVKDFLHHSNRELPFKVLKKHIYLAAKHKTARQFQYWQSCDKRTTAEDEASFPRILKLSPSQFHSVLCNLRVKGVPPVATR